MKFRDFVLYVGILQLVLLISIFFDIPILRQIAGFVYLTFIPGMVILYLLNLDKVDVENIILYAVGLSLAFLMLLGFLINLVLPTLGISFPLSTYSVFFSLSLTILFLLFISHRLCARDVKLFMLSTQKHFTTKKYASLVFLFLFPVLSVVGTKLMNATENNALLLLLIMLIIFFSFLTISQRDYLSPRIYLIALFTISISLLLMNSMSTNRLVGYDIHGEYHVFLKTDSQSIWSPLLGEEYRQPGRISAYITSLSVTILPVIYRSTLNISHEYVFKLILILPFSLLPLIIFRITQYQADKYISFLSALFFTILGYFYSLLPMVLRQGFAFIFFALFMLAFFDDKIEHLKKKLLFVIFIFSTIVSHYSTAIVMSLILTALFLWNLIERKKSNEIRGNTIALTWVSLFAWQVYTEGAFLNFVELMKNFMLHLSELMEPHTKGTSVLALLGMQAYDPIVEIGYYIGTITRIFIIVGAIYIYLNKEAKFKRNFSQLQLINLGLLLFVILTPYLSKGYNTERVYLQALIVLAPSFAIGGLKILDWLSIKKRTIKLSIIVLIICIHFTFQSGLIYQFTTPRVQLISLARQGNMFGRLYVHEQDIQSAKWLRDNYAENKPLFTDIGGGNILTSYAMFPDAKIWIFKESGIELFSSPYIYFRYSNVIDGKMVSNEYMDIDIKGTNIPAVLQKANRIYDNGASEVYHLEK